MSAATNDGLYREAASGNGDAFTFLQTIIGIAHVWDDLIDKDKPVSDELVHSAFQNALLTLSTNPFYARYRHLLEPVLMMSIINWRAATQTEREKTTPWTFILRSSYVDLIVMTKMITGGVDAAVQFATVVRNDIHHEGVDGYVNALADETMARGE